MDNQAETAPATAPVLDPYYLEVDAADVKFLKDFQKRVVGNDLRLWWEPVSKRGQTPVTPTHVKIMAERESMKAGTLAQLEANRAERRPAPEARQFAPGTQIAY